MFSLPPFLLFLCNRVLIYIPKQLCILVSQFLLIILECQVLSAYFDLDRFVEHNFCFFCDLLDGYYLPHTPRCMWQAIHGKLLSG